MKIDFRSFREKLEVDKRDLPPMGLRVYTGPQGAGKTLSMVHDALEMLARYPQMMLVTNLEIKIEELKARTYSFEGAGGLRKALNACRNGENGILMLVDEFQLFASKKDGVSMDVFHALCQQRKQRRFMMGTAQNWEDVDVSTRKKVKEVVKCCTIAGKFQFDQVYDGYSIKWDNRENNWTCRKIGVSIFKHNTKLYSKYDTYAEVITNKDRFEVPTSLAKSVAAPASPKSPELSLKR